MDTHGFALIAAGVILFGLVSKKLEGTIITAPMVSAAFGLLIGEAVFGLAIATIGGAETRPHSLVWERGPGHR